MKIFRIRHHENNTDIYHPAYFSTIAEVKERLRDSVGSGLRADIVVEQLEVSTDKTGIVAALNGMPDYTVERTWGLTARGGLKEE